MKNSEQQHMCSFTDALALASWLQSDS